MQFLQNLLNPLNLLIFLSVVTVLVAAHEYGHYLFARIFKMEIEEFAIGFARPRWIFRTANYQVEDAEGVSEHETVFTVRPLPLGGFVRIAGMQPEVDGSETSIRNGFYSKSPFARWVVLFAGPVFSILAGILILIPLYMATGISEADKNPVIFAMTKGGPADKAGLLPGDKIESLDGVKTKTFYDVVKYVRERPNQELSIVYTRKGKTLSGKITPERDLAPTPVLDEHFDPTSERKIQGKLQIGPNKIMRKLSFGEAAATTLVLPYKMVAGLIEVFASPSKFQENMGGPMTMLNATAGAVKSGPAGVLELSGLLSISLGILNLLPFPPFDGGQMMIALAEMLRRGKRLGYKVQEFVFGAGTVLVGLLIIGVFWSDIRRNFLTKQEAPKAVKSLDDPVPSKP